MASPYATGTPSGGGGASSGSPYARGTPAGGGGRSTSTKGGGGGGFLGFLKQGATDIKNVAYHTPGGVATIAKASYHDWKSSSPWASKQQRSSPSQVLRLGKGTVKQIGSDLQHPGRHPGYTLLDLLPFVNAAAKVGEASRVAAAGEGAAATAKALVRRPVRPARTLTRGNVSIKVGSSQSAMGAAGQRGYDAALHARAAAKPGGIADKLLTRKMGRAVQAEAQTIQNVHKAAGQALISAGRKLKPAEQKALQVVAEQAPLEGRIRAAAARAAGASGKTARRQQAELELLHEAAQHLNVGPDGLPRLAGPQAAKLSAVYDRMQQVATSREELLKGLGQLTDEAIQGRKTNAGRVALGATYEKPTPAKLGVASRALTREQGRLVSLQTRHGKALDKEAADLAKAGGRDLRPSMTEAQIQARIDELAGQHQALLEKFVPEVSPYSKADIAAETRSRNTMRGRMAAGKKPATGKTVEGRVGGGSKTIKTVGQEQLDLAQRKLDEIMAAHPEHPVVKKAAAAAAEREQLQAALNARGEASLEGTRAPMLPRGGERPAIPAASRPMRNRIVRLGLALEEQQKRVAAMEKQAAARVQPTGILGAEHFAATPEAIRVPDVATRGGRSLGRQSSVGTGGSIGHLRALGSTTHEYTGALREAGVRRQDTTALIGESSMEAAKYAGLRHVHEIVRQAATPEPTSTSDIAVRLGDLSANARMPLEVRQFLDDPEQFFKHATPAQAASAFEGVRARLFINPRRLDPQAAADFQQLNAEGKIGWVPKQLLGDLAKPHLPYTGKAVKTVDAINNASRFAILYTKPAYAIPNILGNAALNILQQGFAAVPNLARAARLSAALGPEAARVDALMGEGFARAISAHEQGLGAGVVDKAASLWSRGVDIPFRRSSFLYESRRAGYTTPAQIKTLLTDPAHQPQLTEIVQRANREVIDYANLHPTEREVIRRVIFFYPWVKGSTVYAGRLLREHPVKAGVLGQLGAVGQQHDPTAPSYLEGSFDVGGRLVNPSSTTILQTPAQVGQAVAGLAGGDVGQVGQLSNFLSPALATALAATTRRDRQGYAYPKGANLGQIGFDQLVKNLPQFTLGQRISDALNGKGQDRLYPPNVRDALLQYIVGGVAPRRYNKAKLAELAANERSRYVP